MFQSLKRDVAYFHSNDKHYFLTIDEFQSLKRDVAYFHSDGPSPGTSHLTVFQSLKRDVAYFH